MAEYNALSEGINVFIGAPVGIAEGAGSARHRWSCLSCCSVSRDPADGGIESKLCTALEISSCFASLDALSMVLPLGSSECACLLSGRTSCPAGMQLSTMRTE